MDFIGMERPAHRMRDWIVIPLIALLGLGYWVFSRRPVAGAEKPEGPAATAASGGTVAPIENGERAASSAAPALVPNTTIAPHPEHRVMATLTFDGPPGTVPVKHGELLIGRHSNDDVRIPDVRVSRHHARLTTRSDGGFVIHNLTAVRPEPNSMLVNGTSRERAEIADGDVITLGGVSFQFRLATA